MKAYAKNAEEAIQLFKDVKDIEDTGAWGVEVECVPEEVLGEISKNTSLVTISIGSGTTAGPGKSGHIHVHVGDTNHNDGGEILLEAGSTSGNKNGGLFKIHAGSSTGTTYGIGGQLNLYSGHAKKNTGGSLSIIAGSSTDTTSGAWALS